MIVKVRNSIYEIRDGNKEQIQIESHFKELTIKSEDSLTLKSLFRKSQNPEKGTIVLVHGIRAYKETFIPLSNFLDSLGYNTLLIDLRAHGKSEGEYCTFGYKEKNDISLWIDKLLKENSGNTNIGIWGQSLGGAISLQSMALDKRIKFGIIESTYSNYNTIVGDYFSQLSGFQAKPITNYLIWRSDYLAEMESDSINPIDACKEITQPIFIAHGTSDKKIKLDYNRSNFEAIPCKQKTWLSITEAGHLDLWKKGGKKYFDAIQRFLSELNQS